MSRVVFLLFSLLCFATAMAQDYSNLRTKTIALKSDTTVFDTLAISDFKILAPDSSHAPAFVLDAVNARLICKERVSITISYRVLNIPLSKVYQHKSRQLIRTNDVTSGKDITYVPTYKSNTFQDEPGLNKSGVISRGISVGNNQDLVLNSIFNLQLSGKLNEEWNVLGSVSDDNTQLQPDGNTLQLQEFDKVFIKIYNSNKQITVGDFELKPELSQSYFMRYYKRNRGVYFSAQEVIDSVQHLHYGGSAAAAKGRYARQVVTVIDGNQGPYRLKGNNGELYVLINAGSERIYLDDQLLVRGYDHDYIIDYNTGELSFTSRRLIVATSRVIAEFQYTDRNYARAVLNGFAEWQHPKYDIRLHYFSEKDLKNQPVLLELTDIQKQKLASVGDSTSLAFSSSAIPVNKYTSEKILYRKIDTLGYQQVYVLANSFSTDTIFYELVFNEVGSNKGNYRLLKSSVNGKVYEFVPPLNGILQGSAEPVLPLTAPQSLQNISVGLEYRINKKERVSIEVAGSNFDRNEFSRKDKQDDKGIAVHTFWEQKLPITTSKKKLEFITNASLDYIHQHYKTTERFRDINFTRVWNRTLSQVADASSQAAELTTSYLMQLQQGKDKYVNIGRQEYRRQSEQEGVLWNANVYLKEKGNTITAYAEAMRDDLKLLKLNNTNTSANISLSHQVTKPLALGGTANIETSAFLPYESDTLHSQSFKYTQGLVFAQWLQRGTLLRLEASRRNNAAPYYTGFFNSFSTNLLSANGGIQKPLQSLQFQVQYKLIEVHNPLLTTLKNDASLTFQIQHGLQDKKNSIQHTLQCNAGSGQEQKRIYIYIEVPAGRGTYAWRDYNQDGARQLNEFEQAYNVDEAKFARTLVPTLDFTKVNYFALYETLLLQPYKRWNQSHGFKKVLSKFENRLTYKNEFKQYAQQHFFVTTLLPSSNDTTLINNSSLIENNFLFNRSFNVFDMRYNIRKTGNASLLTYGLEQRKKLEHEVVLRYSFNSVSFIQCFLQKGVKQLSSQYFTSRDYRFNYYALEPKFNIELKRVLRLTFRAKYYSAKEEIVANTHTENIEGGLDVHWYLSSKSFLDSRLSMLNIKFSGEPNTTVAYEMLQGLNNGKNVLIFLTFLHQVSSNMQINLNYNGRSSVGKTMVHTGGVEVRYLF